MAAIKWSDDAIKDFWRLHQFLHTNTPEAAKRMAQVVLGGSLELAASPGRGRLIGDDSGRRELYLAFGGGYYVLRYELTAEGLPFVLRVWHSREDRNPV